MDVTPHSPEIERAYLAIPMLEPELMIPANLLIRPEVFYLERHRAIWRAMCEVAGRADPLDELTIQAELESAGKLEMVGGVAYLAGLSLDLPVGGLENVESYAGILRGLWAKRRLIVMCSDLTAASLNGNSALDLIAQASTSLEAISLDQAGGEGPRRIAESIAEFDRWEPLPAGELLGVTTGLIDLDNMLLGLQPGQQLVLAARPSMGKTALALCMALAAAKAGVSVVFFSLEMPEAQLARRLLSVASGVPLRSILLGQLSEAHKKKLRSAMDALAPLPLFIDDRPGLSPAQISATAAVHKMKHGLGLVIVDYLGLVRYVGKLTEEVDTLGDVTRSLRECCRKLEVPNLLLHQLNREVERRGDKRPTMADLRGSGKIEEHADVIAFIYRDEVYNEKTETPGIAEIILAKHRQGAIGKVEVVFTPHLTLFRSLDRRQEPFG